MNEFKSFIIICGIIAIVIISGCIGTTIITTDWEEPAFTRKAIHNYDIVIKWLEEDKYEEAAVLADATGTYLWYLRNAKDTQFYDELHDKTEYVFFDAHINWYKDNPDKIEHIIENIKNVQIALCPKSDMTYEWGLQCSNKYPEAANCFETVRCYQNGTQINMEEIVEVK